MFFSITRDDISPAITKLIAEAHNKVPVLRAMGTSFLSITMGNFSSVGANYRPQTWPNKKDGTISNLKKSGTLSKSFTLTLNSESATVSNPMPYAAIHQFGGKTKPHRIEPRRAKALAFMMGGQQIFAGGVNHPGSNIPARPFFPVDQSGKLTEKAETLIKAAGEREFAKQAKLEG